MNHPSSSSATAGGPSPDPRTPLPAALRAEMEDLFRSDLSTVRLRHAPLPAGLAACASGDEIVLANTRLDVESLAARRLVAHEITHVLQQRRGEVRGRGMVIDPVLEHEAEMVASCVGREATAARHIIRRLARPAQCAASHGVVQPRIIIQNGTAAGIYDKTRARELFDAVAVPINGKYKGRPVKVRDEPITNYLRSADYYRFDSVDALAQYMVQARVTVQGDVVAIDVPIPRPNHPAPTLIYGAEHGDYHFGGAPTKNKAKWDLEKPAARALMEAEILKYHRRIWRETPLNGVAGKWYVAGPRTKCGRYADGTRLGAYTDTFCIQAQVFIFENEIHYHGYPDEQIRNHGCGMTRNGVNANDEEVVERHGREGTIAEALRQLA